jgi:urease accessory protein
MTQHLAQTVHPAGTWEITQDACELTYDARFLRRKVIETRAGQSVLVDLPKTTSLGHGDALETGDGLLIEIIAADEALLQITGENLVQLAWHIGNRHTPCQIEADHLLIQSDPVIGHMLEHLGATVTQVLRPFTPEGGAYGYGRTHSHEHGHTAHDHDHAHPHDHDHDHAH